MTSLPFFQVDAFADRPLTGNPAGVMPLERWLDEPLMQSIAAENNLSETAFTVPSERDDADYDLRWFTPEAEVPLCGHATIASGHVLIHSEPVRFSTKSGILVVSRHGDLLETERHRCPHGDGRGARGRDRGDRGSLSWRRHARRVASAQAGRGRSG